MRSVPDVQPSGCHPPGIRTTTRLAPTRPGIRDETSGVCGAPELTHPISAEARLGCFWAAGPSTHGLGRAGVGICVKGRVTPDGDHSLPPLSVRGLGFNAFVSGPHRRGGTLPYGHQPHCPPQQQREAAVREGRGRGSDPSGHARFPSAVAGVATPGTRVSAGTSGCADLFTATVCARAV